MKCEIKSSCSPSVCQQTNQMTVHPGSNITLNCSIITGELVQGMTWARVKNSTGLSNLVLQRSNTTKNNQNMPCRCTNIKFTRRYFFYCPNLLYRFLNTRRSTLKRIVPPTFRIFTARNVYLYVCSHITLSDLASFRVS